MNTHLPGDMMRCFNIGHGRYINTLSKRYSQKGFDAIKLIVSDFLSGGNFYIKNNFVYPTLSKGYSDAIKLIVEFVFWLFQKAKGKRSILPIIQGSIGLKVHVFPLEKCKIDGIFDVMEIGQKC